MNNSKIFIIVIAVIFLLKICSNPTKPSFQQIFSITQEKIEKYEEADKIAANAAINEVKSNIKKYKNGIKPFIDDVSDIGSRLTIAKGYLLDSDKKNIENYIREKFEDHIFSSKELDNDLTYTLLSLQKKLNENREDLLSDFESENIVIDNKKFKQELNDFLIEQVSQDISNIIVRDMIISYSKGIKEEIRDSIRDEVLTKVSKLIGIDKIVNRIVNNMAKSLVQEVGIEAASAMGAEIATQIGIQLIEAIGVEVVVEFLAAEIPALAVGAAASAIPGIGPLIALAAVPLVDMVLNNDMKKDLDIKLNNYFEIMEKSIIYGDNNNGLENNLNDFLNKIHGTQKIVLLERIYIQEKNDIKDNKEELFKLAQLASEYNIKQAQLDLSTMYKNGVGVRKNEEESDKWLNTSKNNIGIEYNNQNTVSPNYDKAIDFDYNSPAIDFIIKMITTDNEEEIYSAKANIESLPKPQRINRKEARKLNDQALLLMKQSNNTDAIQLLESARKNDLTDAEIANNLATAYIFNNEIDKAKKLAIDTLSLKPDRSLGWKSLGYIFGKEKNLLSAEKCFINYYRFSKDREKAFEILEKLLEKETDPITHKAIYNASNTILQSNKIGSLDDSQPKADAMKTLRMLGVPVIPQ